MTRALLVWAAALGIFFVAGPARADVPAPDRLRASALHAEAIALFASKKLDAACRLWSQAERADPSWKYAFNLAGGLLELGEPLDAWAALERAEGYGIAPENQGRVGELRSRVRAVLAKSYGLLEVRVVPADARVSLDGAPIGRRVWLVPGTVNLHVERAGYSPQPLSATVVRGEERVLSVSLEAIERRPTTIGRQLLDVEPAASGRQSLELSFDAGLSPQRIAGYTTLGVGVVAVAVGIGLVGWADSMADDAAAENGAPSTSDYATYAARFGDDRERYDAVWAGGWASVGVGLAAVVTGLTLVLVDEDGESSGSVVVQPDGVRASWHF